MKTITGNRIHKGWEIEGFGGFCTIRHYWATKETQSFWMFKLRDVKAKIDDLENNTCTFNEIPELHRQPLYN